MYAPDFFTRNSLSLLLNPTLTNCNLTEKRLRLNDRLHRFSKQSGHSEEDSQPETGKKMTAAVAGKQDLTGFRSTRAKGDKDRAHQEKATA